jgi:phosphate/sulfate permease
MALWDAVSALPPAHLLAFAFALVIAFGFEFINGFHDTANAVASVIYTRSLRPTPAVFFSGVMNFFGVLLGGTAVAFGIVNLLPVDMLVAADANAALVTVLSLLVAAVAWNLGTWYLGLPVSSSHTLIGSILGVGLASSVFAGKWGVNWSAAGKVGLGLLISPVIGFVGAALLLMLMKRVIRTPRLYQPPNGGADRPPGWIRSMLIGTCGAVSFAHGSNDGQKGMGLILLVLIGFLPAQYALDLAHPNLALEVRESVTAARAELVKGDVLIPPQLATDFDLVTTQLSGKETLEELPSEQRWEVRKALLRISKALKSDDLPEPVHEAVEPHREKMTHAIEFVPKWVVVGVAIALGVGTTVGYKRIVVTVAERIGTMQLTYGQGGAAQTVAAGTILVASFSSLPVSTTQVLSSGVAGTMLANGANVQTKTVQKILLAWVFTLPSTMALSAGLYTLGRWFFVG